MIGPTLPAEGTFVVRRTPDDTRVILYVRGIDVTMDIPRDVARRLAVALFAASAENDTKGKN